MSRFFNYSKSNYYVYYKHDLAIELFNFYLMIMWLPTFNSERRTDRYLLIKLWSTKKKYRLIVKRTFGKIYINPNYK